jgi:hypothetical protein
MKLMENPDMKKGYQTKRGTHRYFGVVPSDFPIPPPHPSPGRSEENALPSTASATADDLFVRSRIFASSAILKNRLEKVGFVRSANESSGIYWQTIIHAIEKSME